MTMSAAAKQIQTGRAQIRAASTLPWYREPWPWILMAGPAVVIIAGIVTAWLAVRSSDGLVADDYYKRGLAVNQVLARAREAERRGIEATLKIAPDTDGALHVQLRSATAEFPQSIGLAFSHPTRAGLDQRIHSAATATPGVYSGRISPLAPGRWTVIVEDGSGQWRIRGALHVPNERETQLGPGS
jgi:hypothetical protein